MLRRVPVSINSFSLLPCSFFPSLFPLPFYFCYSFFYSFLFLFLLPNSYLFLNFLPLLEYMSSHSNTASTFERSSEIISSRKASLISQLEIFFFSLRKTTRAVLHKLYFEYDFFPMWISPEILWKCRLTDGGSENGSWDSAFLTHSPMMLMPLVCQLHTE